jgi:hypothetical protein
MKIIEDTGFRIVSKDFQTSNVHCPQLDHHDADGLAGQKTWRITQTTMRRCKYTIQKMFIPLSI